MASSHLHSDFSLKEKVHIDDDPSITASVTAMTWRTSSALLEVSWIQDGQNRACWVEPWRLTTAEKPCGHTADDGACDAPGCKGMPF